MRRPRAPFYILLIVPVLLTAVLMMSSSDEVSLSDLITQNGRGTPASPRVSDSLRQQAELVVAVFLNWRLMLFGLITICAAVIAVGLTWRAVQIARRLPKGVGFQQSSQTETRADAPVVRQSSLRALVLGTRLTFRMTRALAFLLAMLGLLVIGTAYYQVSTAVTRQIGQRVLTTARNLAEVAGPRIAAKDMLGLHALIGRYSIGNEVVYIVIGDREGKIVAHNLSVPVAQIDRAWPLASEQETVTFTGEEVLESRAPITGGNLGTVYFGVSKAAIAEQVRAAVNPIISIVALLFVAAIAVGVVLARRIAQPILALRAGADRISHGVFDQPVGVQTSDEIGELAQSLERIRSSLHAAIVRLSRQS